jgi:hypothetical protein
MLGIQARMWQAIDEEAGLFGVEKWSPRGWHWRGTALRLDRGGLLLIGPLRGLGDDAHGELCALGRPEAVLAPNHYHWMGLPEHRERYPDALVATSEVAARRLAGKERGRFGTVEAVARRLPAGAELMAPPGLKNGEIWLRVASPRGVTWVVSDAFFSLASNARGLMGLILRWTGTTPGLRIGRTFTSLGIGERTLYRDWLLDRIAADRPTALVPGHGEVLRGDDLADRLDALVRGRLGNPRKQLAA